MIAHDRYAFLRIPEDRPKYVPSMIPRALTCGETIDLSTTIRSERVRGFQPPWRTVYVYRCVCGAETRIAAGSYRGVRKTPSGQLVGVHPEPSIGFIRCAAVASTIVPALYARSPEL